MNVDPASVLVFDTTVLSNFAISESIGWLTEQYPRGVTVPAVRDELARGVDLGYDALTPAVDALTGGEIDVESEASEVLQQSYPSIQTTVDRGEAEAMAAVLEHETDAVLVTDDRVARELAAEYDLAVTGSVGLLARGIVADALSVQTADAWLERWQTDGNYIAPVESVTEILPEDERD